MSLVSYGIDFGTDSVKIYSQQAGRVLCESSLLAVTQENEVIAVGKDAYSMLGKTPPSVRVESPMKSGRIADREEASFVLKTLIKRSEGRIPPAKLYVSVPVQRTAVINRAYVETCRLAFGRKSEIYFLDRPICDAIGFGIPITRTKGSVVVNIGEYTTELSVVSAEQIVISRQFPIGGAHLTEAITQAVQEKMNLLIGGRTARRLKAALVTFGDVPDEGRRIVGMDTLSGLPRETSITAQLASKAAAEPIKTLAGEIRDFIERTPPQIMSAAASEGIYLSGGTARIPFIEQYIRRMTGIGVNISSAYEQCTVQGIKEIIESDALQRLAKRMRA